MSAAEVAYVDRELVCKDCNNGFTFDTESQAYFASRGYVNDPLRCKECRQAKKAAVNRSYGPKTCYNCGSDEHLVGACPNPPTERSERKRGSDREFTPRPVVLNKACYMCGESGHLSSTCPQKPEQGGFQSSRGRGGSSRGPLTCFECNEVGHRSFECPNRSAPAPSGFSRPSRGRGGGRGGASGPRTCYSCGSTDHLSYDCPDKQQQ